MDGDGVGEHHAVGVVQADDHLLGQRSRVGKLQFFRKFIQISGDNHPSSSEDSRRENQLIAIYVELKSCSIFQLCQLSEKDPHHERHHDDNVAKTSNVVDGNIQAGCNETNFKGGSIVWSLPIAVFLPSGLARTNPAGI